VLLAVKNLVEHNAERVFAKQPMENFNVVLRALAGPTPSLPQLFDLVIND
jgi:hypothetical protein